jgi:hypothetical protein
MAQDSRTSLDTIFCDTKNTSYMVFSQDVSLCDLGYADDYVAQVKDNVVFVKALKEGVEPTTVFIKSGKDIYFGMLKYKIQNKKYYYDFKVVKDTTEGSLEGTEAKKTTRNVTEEQKKISTTQASVPNKKVVSIVPGLKSKTEDFVKIKNELSTLGFVSPTLDAALTVIRNDNSNTFLKIICRNKSSIAYKLDFISFQYYQDMKKGAFRKSRKAPIDVFPVAEPIIKEIAPGKTETLSYVIPSYALANNGYLMMLVRESSGDRVLKIKVGGAVIQNSQQLTDANGK